MVFIPYSYIHLALIAPSGSKEWSGKHTKRRDPSHLLQTWLFYHLFLHWGTVSLILPKNNVLLLHITH